MVLSSTMVMVLVYPGTRVLEFRSYKYRYSTTLLKFSDRAYTNIGALARHAWLLNHLAIALARLELRLHVESTHVVFSLRRRHDRKSTHIV